MAEAFETEPPSELPPDVEDMLAADGQRKKTRTRLVLFLVLPVLIASIGGAAWYFGEQTAEREIAEGWSATSSCLVGTPLAPGEVASLRVRAIQLNAVRVERDRKADDRWPNRCAAQLAQLHEALRKHGRDKDGEKGLSARTEAFAVALRKVQVMTDISAQLDGLFAAAEERGLVAQPVSQVDPTPEPDPGLTLDSLPESAQITARQYTLDRVSSTAMVGTELHALVYDKGLDPKPILCTFTQSGQDHCRELAGEVAGKGGLALGGTVDDGATPLILVGRQGEEGVYRGDTLEKITALRVQSAYVSKDGYVAIASRALDSDGQFDLIQQAGPGQPPQTTRIKPSVFRPKVNQIHRKQLLWGKLLVQVLDDEKKDMKPRLQYKQLPTAKPNSAFEDIAMLSWINAPILGCKTPDTMVVRIGSHSGFVTFFSNEHWSTPLPAESFPPAFTCDRGEAVFTADGDQRRCTAAACRLVEGVPATFEPFPVRQRFWTDLNAKLLSVALTEDRGGLRFRHAEGKNLQLKGDDRLLLDDLVYDGKVQQDTGILGILMAGRGQYAVVLLSTRKGVYAIRFAPDGSVKPATISRN